ncbi:hypothetical protein [Methylobacterium pseudosasicola]|uniref:Uncharacterized protein n=1 Tax=Methylobacterium pseudosasicola TaxID=582667 RepID=A0A1I4F9H8_9HYPH|nr:hypothetical protein [Methylobacterium pseudosasicola]SFL14083.1 hypothetical protein SAMN05192568_1001152 [Methylobacterium pseudosasicola]
MTTQPPSSGLYLRWIGRALVLGAVSGSFGLTVPALSQSAASRIDQPTPGTLPPASERDSSARGSGQVSPPSAIQSSTDVMQSDGTVQGQGAPARTNPIQHLPETMR